MSETLIYHLLPREPEKTVKKRIVYYYASQSDLALARTLVTREREARRTAFPRDATTFSDNDVEPCDEVVIMPDVAKHHRDALENFFRGKVNEDVDFAAIVLQPPAPEPASVEERYTPSAPSHGPADLSMMTKKELRDLAATRGIKLGSAVSRRDDLIATIEAAHA